MKKCEKCGTISDSKFCPECGESMVNAEFVNIIKDDEKTEGAEKTVEPPKKKSKFKKVLIAIVILVLLLFGLALCAPTEDSTTTEGTDYTTEKSVEDKFTTESDYNEISYDDLARTPDGYEGDKVTASGEVVQVVEGENEIDLRVAVNGDYDTIIYLYYDPDIVASRILEGDYVTYYGISKGLYSYESTMGGQITIPLVHVQKISRD